MTEEQIKTLCKWIIDNGNRPFSDSEKVLIKQAIDKAKNVKELTTVAIATIKLTEGR